MGDKKIERFEDIIAWQKARELVNHVYRVFNNTKDFNFREQIQRASVSVMNNIAEGFERRTNNEFKHFLFMAKGSCGEVRSMLYAALDLKMITEEIFNELMNFRRKFVKFFPVLLRHCKL